MLIAVIAIGAIFCAGVFWELEFSHLWYIKVTIPRIARGEWARIDHEHEQLTRNTHDRRNGPR